MGRYLNSSTSYVLYKGQTEQSYFVDKSQMLSELFPFLDSGNTHICITRPRRFGKTVMANMITAFLGKKQDSDSIFKSLKISQNDLYNKYRNQYNVISIDFSKMPRDCDSYTDYIDRIETNLIRDLRKEYPQIEIYEDDSAADVLETIFEECDQQRFVFVLDEWDFIFHKDFVTEENKKQYVLFLSNLLKDRSYVQLTYMTGILPIAKYSSGSELNMFWEYTMASEAKYNEYFGFTDQEVRDLLTYYECADKYESIKEWYDGYRFGNVDVYCPWDVVSYLRSLRTNREAIPQNYWINTSSNAEVKEFIRQSKNLTTKREIERLMAGESITKTIHPELTYKEMYESIENIWSVLFATGYLTQSGQVDARKFKLRIPNLEIRDIFKTQIMEYFKESVAKDGDMLGRFCKALKNGEEKKVEDIFESYLKKTISIRDTFVRKEMKENFYHGILLGILGIKEEWGVFSNQETGEGYSDILIETENSETAILIEVKYAGDGNLDVACERALKQVEERKYDEELRENGVDKILKYGIACYMKRCKVKLAEESYIET